MKITRLLSVLALTVAAATANAASVSLVPGALTVDEGANFDIDLVLDATDTLVPGFSGSMSGVVVIEYDPSLVSFSGFAYNSPASANEPLMMANLSGVEVVGIDFTNAATAGAIGTYSFTAVAPSGSVIDIAISASMSAGFANESPTNKPFFPDFENTAVSVVPIPASAWLMMSAIGFTAGFLRRRT
ncbi:MAG: hypothetical protein KJP03_04670 [Gammaproteobacteria bacterium]|nr:hypothetical protein [Gammaproteobacteria bacterium]